MQETRSKFVPILLVAVAVVGIVWLALLLLHSRPQDTTTAAPDPARQSILAMVPATADAVLYAAPSLVKSRLESAPFFQHLLQAYGGDPFGSIDEFLGSLGLGVADLAETAAYVMGRESAGFLPTTVIFRYDRIASDSLSLFAKDPTFTTRIAGERVTYYRDKNGYEVMHVPPFLAFGNALGTVEWIDKTLASGQSVLRNERFGRFMSQRNGLPLYGFVADPGRLLSALGEPFASATSVKTQLDLRNGLRFVLDVETPNLATTLKSASAVAKAWSARPVGFDAPTDVAYNLAKGLAMVFAEPGSLTEVRTWGKLSIQVLPRRISLEFVAPKW